MESIPFAIDEYKDQEKQASLSGAPITILTALTQGDWEQRVNERELRYLELLEQRIEILERKAEAPWKRQVSRRRRRSSPIRVEKVGRFSINNPAARLNPQQIPSNDSGSDSDDVFNFSDNSVSDISAPYRDRARSRRRRKYVYVRDSGANSKASSILEIRPTSLEEPVPQASEDLISMERVLFEPRYRVISPVKTGREEGSYAFKWITRVDFEDDSVWHEAVIQEGDLKRALADELQDFPVHFDPGEICFDRHFDLFIHAWDRLENIVAGSKPGVSVETREDLKALLSLIREVEGLKAYFNSRSLDSRSSAIAYGDLWTVFVPGTLIYASPMDCPQAFLVNDFIYRQKGPKEFVVLCWSYGKEYES